MGFDMLAEVERAKYVDDRRNSFKEIVLKSGLYSVEKEEDNSIVFSKDGTTDIIEVEFTEE